MAEGPRRPRPAAALAARPSAANRRWPRSTRRAGRPDCRRSSASLACARHGRAPAPAGARRAAAFAAGARPAPGCATISASLGAVEAPGLPAARASVGVELAQALVEAFAAQVEQDRRAKRRAGLAAAGFAGRQRQLSAVTPMALREAGESSGLAGPEPAARRAPSGDRRRKPRRTAGRRRSNCLRGGLRKRPASGSKISEAKPAAQQQAAPAGGPRSRQTASTASTEAGRSAGSVAVPCASRVCRRRAALGYRRQGSRRGRSGRRLLRRSLGVRRRSGSGQLEGGAAEEQPRQRQAVGVDVGRRAERLAARLLGRHVAGRAGPGGVPPRRLASRRRPTVPRSSTPESSTRPSPAALSAAMPKSTSSTRPSSQTIMLPGLTSQCTRPWTCAAARPAPTARKTSTISCQERGAASAQAATSSPTSSSVVTKTWPRSLPTS